MLSRLVATRIDIIRINQWKPPNAYALCVVIVIFARDDDATAFYFINWDAVESVLVSDLSGTKKSQALRMNTEWIIDWKLKW